jgi:hypothetical protein
MRRTSLSLLLLLPLLVGCTSWRPVELPAPMASEWSARGTLRLTTDRGIRLRGDSAWIAGDTLRLRAVAESTASVPRIRVARLERHGFDKAKTTGLGFGLVILSVFSILIGSSIDIGSGGYY